MYCKSLDLVTQPIYGNGQTKSNIQLDILSYHFFPTNTHYKMPVALEDITFQENNTLHFIILSPQTYTLCDTPTLGVTPPPQVRTIWVAASGDFLCTFSRSIAVVCHHLEHSDLVKTALS